MTSYPPPPASSPDGPQSGTQTPSTGPSLDKQPSAGGPVPPPPYASGGAPVPPPGAPGAAAQKVLVPPTAWLVPLAGVLALIGGIIPWYEPKGTVSGKTALTGEALHSWNDGKIGLLGPIVLIIIGIGVAALLLGRAPGSFGKGSHPVSTAGKYAIGAGVVAIVCTVISWLMLKSQYKIEGPNGQKLSWDDAIKLAKQNGVDLSISRGVQVGLYLTVVAAVLAIVGGGLMLAMHRKADA